MTSSSPLKHSGVNVLVQTWQQTLKQRKLQYRSFIKVKDVRTILICIKKCTDFRLRKNQLFLSLKNVNENSHYQWPVSMHQAVFLLAPYTLCLRLPYVGTVTWQAVELKCRAYLSGGSLPFFFSTTLRENTVQDWKRKDFTSRQQQNQSAALQLRFLIPSYGIRIG